MKTTIIANYNGFLTAEKHCVYTTRRTDATVWKPLDVIIPDEYAPSENAFGEIVITLNGQNVLLQSVLCGDEHPCIRIPDWNPRYVRLAVVDSAYA